MKKYFSLLLVLCLLFNVSDVLAKAGGGGSMGSRGGRTYSAPPSYNAAPIQRSITPPPQSAPSYAPSQPSAPSYAPSYGGGYGGGHPFLSGLAGGFIGGGLASMLFGHGGYGGGYGYGDGVSPTGSMIGGLLQLLVIGGIGYFVYRLWRGSSIGGGMSSQYNQTSDASFQPTQGIIPSMPQSQQIPFTPNDSDMQAFHDVLEKIQLAWGKADLTRLRGLVTPEMLQYFGEELSANTSKGLTNIITSVSDIQAEGLEAWSEPEAGLDYATLRMTWKAIDFMARLDKEQTDADYVASGDAKAPVPATEIWTFARAHSGGHWLLSAIQQVA